MTDKILDLLNQASALIEQAKTIWAEREKIDLQFHDIEDIRLVYDVDPARSYWVVDYRIAADCLPRSWRFDRLTDESKRAVLHAYLDKMLGVEGTDPTSMDDICETLDKYFSLYWDLIPEIKFQ